MAAFPGLSSEPLPAHLPLVTSTRPCPAGRQEHCSSLLEIGRCIIQELCCGSIPLCSVKWFCTLWGANTKRFYFYSIIALNHVLFAESFVLWYLGMAVHSFYENLDQSNLKLQGSRPPRPTSSGLIHSRGDPHPQQEVEWSALSLPLFTLLWGGCRDSFLGLMGLWLGHS